jgi:hypothetical protein
VLSCDTIGSDSYKLERLAVLKEGEVFVDVGVLYANGNNHTLIQGSEMF